MPLQSWRPRGSFWRPLHPPLTTFLPFLLFLRQVLNSPPHAGNAAMPTVAAPRSPASALGAGAAATQSSGMALPDPFFTEPAAERARARALFPPAHGCLPGYPGAGALLTPPLGVRSPSRRLAGRRGAARPPVAHAQ